MNVTEINFSQLITSGINSNFTINYSIAEMQRCKFLMEPEFGRFMECVLLIALE